MKHFDVVVVGGGHAGCEAADAAARLGVRVALLTLRRSDLGAMSCNPAIGGLGKGHLVREIDALGGLMGHAADASGIQFRLLNRSKGPAVQGPRAQADRALYSSAIGQLLLARENLEIIEGEVADAILSGENVCGVILADGSQIGAGAVVLTTGTFLGGVIHMGRERIPAGRVGAAASIRLADRLRELGLVTGRLKTGTPPRLRKGSIDWTRLVMQPGDEDPVFFSFQTKGTEVQQVSCGITETNERTHEIIWTNLTESAVFGGEISGRGPRYCPSIEDKVVRFADKTSHQVFLEPEGLTSDLVYPNGISTSLPTNVQEDYVRSMTGLESAEIVQPGYAIEYDYADPRALSGSLEVSKLRNLYLAGQINGTTGYEEAAAQGLVAGVSAARVVLGEAEPTFSRAGSYIGVMIDDLTVRGVTEPYRMFTSRAEFRLSLRADNADQRLTPYARDLGLVDEGRWRTFSEKMETMATAKERLSQVQLSAATVASATGALRAEGPKRSALECLEVPGIDWADLEKIGVSTDFPADIKSQIKRDAQYAQYIERQRQDVERLRKDENVLIPREINYSSVNGLSNELSEKLKATKPNTISQAARIEGMTPSALLLLLSYIRKHKRAV